MSDFDEVRAALEGGAHAAQFQFSQASNIRTRDDADENRRSIAGALKALDRIAGAHKPCTRAHIEHEYEPETTCQCATVKMPPCSWCENGGDPS